MLDIATRIMNGMSYELPRGVGGNKLPGSWEESGAEEDEWGEDEDEDDFGIPLGNLRRESDVSAVSRESRRSSGASVD